MSTRSALSTQAVAERLSVSDRSVRRWIIGGQLAAIVLGSSIKPIYRIDADELERFIDARRRPGKKER